MGGNFLTTTPSTLAITVNSNTLFYTGSNSCDHLLAFSELLRKQRENVCGLQSLNIVSKR